MANDQHKRIYIIYPNCSYLLICIRMQTYILQSLQNISYSYSFMQNVHIQSAYKVSNSVATNIKSFKFRRVCDARAPTQQFQDVFCFIISYTILYVWCLRSHIHLSNFGLSKLVIFVMPSTMRNEWSIA